jgi:predicted ATP-grasp superfamily ATP-dependent carboligase
VDAPPVLNALNILIVGISTRAAAESAARAGFGVTAVDAFGDLDQCRTVRSLSLPRDFGRRFTVGAAVRAAGTIECEAVAYAAGFENHPGAVRRLAANRALWGNAPEVLRSVRNPVRLADTLEGLGLAAAAVRGRLEDGSRGRNWLVKPLRSGGGRGVRPWRGETLPHGCYLQERIEGAPGSIAFVAAGGHAVPLGVCAQLVGEPAFGATGHQYCGNILVPARDTHFPRDEALAEATYALVAAVAHEFGLVGANGVDFVAREGVPYAIEVNPRWSASMELIERAYALSVFGIHSAACTDGKLPPFDLVRARTKPHAPGKAVVFARSDVVIGDTSAWLGDPTVRDVPHPGDRIAAGRPVCTVFADGPDAATCHGALVRCAERVYAELARWACGSAGKPPRPSL